MKKDYTIMVFNNGFLLSLDSPSHCIFNSDVFSLNAKPLEYFFIDDSIDRLHKLENCKKTNINLCAKTSGAILNGFATKTKFQKSEVIVLYFKENLNVTNSDTVLYEKHSVLEEMMLEQNKEIFEQIDSLRTTRNIQQIKTLKESFSNFYHQLECCVFKLLETTPLEKYHFESFHFSFALKNYFGALEAKHPGKLWVSYRNFMTAHVLGNREYLLAMLDSFIAPYLTQESTRILVSLFQKNDTAILELTVLNNADTKAEFSEEFLDFEKSEATMLAKKAGCSANCYHLPDTGTKLVVTYDALTGYHLYENQEE